MEESQKIIIAIHHLKFGGSERAASELANYFRSKGINVKLLLMFDREIEYQIDPKIDVITPEVDYTKTNKLFYLFYLLTYLRKVIKRETPQTVFVLGGKTFLNISVIGLDTRLIYGIRTSPTRERFPGNPILNLIYKYVNKILSFNINGIIVQTEDAKKYLNKESSLDVRNIPNSLRNIKRYDVRREKIILSVGRLSKEKGHEYLIRAFKKANLTDWRLLFLGDGPQKENLQKLSSDLELGDSVIFEGFKSDVDFFMQKSSIFVLPSLYEGFPNALVEAMGNGMSCISFNCEMGPSEIIKHGKNGFLVDERDIESLAHYIVLLADDESLRTRMGEEAQKVREQYHIEKVGNLYLDFLLNNESF